MKDLDNVLKRSRKGDRMKTTASIGSVVNFDKVRSNYGLESGEGNEIYNFYNDLESSSDVSAQGTLDILDDEAFPEFRSLVEDLNNTIDDTIDDKVSQLLLVADVLSRLKREGIIDQLYEEEIIDKDEKNAISSHKVLDYVAQDMLSLGSISILQNRMIDDMSSVLGRLRDNLNTPEVRHGRASHEVVDELVSAGIIDRNRDTKLRSRGNQDETDYRFGSGDRSRDDIRESRDRRDDGRNSARLSRNSSRNDRTGKYNRSPRKKIRLDDDRYSRDRDRRDDRDRDRYDDRRRDDSFRRDDNRRGLDLGRRDEERIEEDRYRRRDDRYDDREERGLLSSRTMTNKRDDRRDDRVSRNRDRDYDRRNDRRDGSRYDRFRRDSGGRRSDRGRREKRDDDNVVYEFHPTS